MAIEVVTPADLEKFRLLLLEDIKKFVHQPPPAKPWLKSSDVRRMLGISPGTLQTLRSNGTIPFTKIGGITFYKYDDVVKIFEKACKKNG